jgi:protein tyrosine phosphatase (PTP) superfamily phosphohydrolase (DUF442 family)
MTSRLSNLARAFVLLLACAQGCCTAGHLASNYPPAPGCDRCSSGAPYAARLTPTPAAPGSAIAGFPPPAQGGWQPGPESGVRLAPPETIATAPPRDYSRPYPAQPTEPPVAAAPPKPGGDNAVTPALPDIPQFAMAKKGVAVGQQPFRDGVIWLKEHGYRTALHIRPPEEKNTFAEQMFKSRDLKYVSLEVSPTTLTRDVVEQFNRLVTDPANQPLFVFDRDGSLAGGLWYLHFRLVDNLSDEKARAEAARLGFRDDGASKTMWIAVQKYLSDLKQ